MKQVDLTFQHHGKDFVAPLKEWAGRKSFPPVLLLTGQPGIGKSSFAQFLAFWILCQNRRLDPLPHLCGECPSCQKNDQDLTPIDLIQVIPEEADSGGPGSSLKIDQFRSIKMSAGFGAHEGSHRIFLISDAEKMTLAAGHSILKLLEEPPLNWVFILTTSDTSLLLPTLISRCQVFRLKPFTKSEIKERLALQGVPSERLEIGAALSQGGWTKAITFVENEVWEKRKTLLQFLHDPIPFIPELVEWASQTPEQFDILMDFFEQVLSEFLTWSQGSPPLPPESFSWVQADGTKELSAHVRKVVNTQGTLEKAREFWFARIECLSKVRERSHLPVNRKLLIQEALLPWLGI